MERSTDLPSDLPADGDQLINNNSEIAHSSASPLGTPLNAAHEQDNVLDATVFPASMDEHNGTVAENDCSDAMKPGTSGGVVGFSPVDPAVNGNAIENTNWETSMDADTQQYLASSEPDDDDDMEDDEEVSDEDLDKKMIKEEHSFTDYENEQIVQYQAAVEAGRVDEERQCWVCFASDEDDPTASWVHPCRCSGTTKWVHHVCIQRWVDEKQKGNNSAGVSCPQCGTDYIIKFPAAGPLMRVVDAGDLLVGRLCPVIAGGVCVGSLYWTCVTYGAVTLMQVAGHEEGLVLMESTDPLLLLVSLPLVPLGLVLGKMVKWQDPVIKVMRNRLPYYRITRYLLPAFATEPSQEPGSSSLPPPSDPVSVTRTFCGALFFPTIATFLGSALFQSTKSPLKRAVLGGLTFVAAKGIIKIYHKQHLYIRQCNRRILDYK